MVDQKAKNTECGITGTLDHRAQCVHNAEDFEGLLSLHGSVNGRYKRGSSHYDDQYTEHPRGHRFLVEVLCLDSEMLHWRRLRARMMPGL